MTRWHVLVDCRFLGTGTGLDRYTRELVGALLSRDDGLDYTLLGRSDDALDHLGSSYSRVITDVAHYSVAEQTRLPRLIARVDPHVVLFPHFNAPLLTARPCAVTLHDLTLHQFPSTTSLARRSGYRLALHTALRRADAVLTVSEWSRGQLLEHYGSWLAGKVTVTGEGVGDQFRPVGAADVEEIRAELGLHRDWFLYVGNCKPHKNVRTLVEAYHLAALDADLVLVTGDPDAQVFSGHGVHVLADVDDRVLARLYSGARAFVTASLAEGFCLPVAEALACGCPVVASNRGAIPEAARGDAVLVEPTVEAIASAMSRPPTRPRARQPHQWSQVADRTVAVIRSLVAS